MESVVFYDGYVPTVDEPVPEGVIRLSNSLYATRLTEEELAVIQPNLQMQVLIGALCDNYDRIGSVQLVPLAVKEAFNNYQEGASDMIGTTTKTMEIVLEADAEDAQLVLITSNHGPNAGGEEYNRREHFVYLDGDLALQYVPGRESCEPFRMYNTQGNGIYGPARAPTRSGRASATGAPAT